MESGAEAKLSSDQVSRSCARSYRTSSGPPHSQRFQRLPASNFRVHRLHSRVVTKLLVMRRLLYLIVLTAATTPLWAGEFVVLGTGFRLHADKHEAEGDVVRIFSGTGVVEMPAASIAGYEQEEITKPLPAVAPTPDVPATPVAIAPKTPAEMAGQAAAKYKLPGSFVASVMKAESGFQTNALSPKGAIGLMQLMPGTERTLGVDPRDPNQNAEGGAQ